MVCNPGYSPLKNKEGIRKCTECPENAIDCSKEGVAKTCKPTFRLVWNDKEEKTVDCAECGIDNSITCTSSS